MGTLYPVKVNSGAGEVSPLLYARVDAVAHETGLELCENFIPLPHGGLTRRGGFEERGDAKITSGSIRLIPWVFSEAPGQQYVLEIGYHGTVGGYIRVWSGVTRTLTNVELNSAQPGSPIQWTATDIANIRWTQKNDVMYLFDGTHPPLKLIRSGGTQPGTWTITSTEFVGVPFELSNKIHYQVRQFDEAYYNALDAMNQVSSYFDHYFLDERPADVKGGFIARDGDGGEHSTTGNITPLAWDEPSRRVNPKPSYLSRTEWFSWEASGYLDIPTNGYYRFGLDALDFGDLWVEGKKLASKHNITSQLRVTNATEFVQNGVIQLTAGAKHIKSRLVKFKNQWESDYGITVGYRQEPSANGIGFTGSGTNNLSLKTRAWHGAAIYEVRIGISTTNPNAFWWQWRACESKEDIETNYGNWHVVVGNESPQTLQDDVVDPLKGYELRGTNPPTTPSLGWIVLPAHVPGTAPHQPGDYWTIKFGYTLIPNAMFTRTQFTKVASYPRVGCFYQERLVLGGFPEKPNAIQCSKIGEFENFIWGTNAAEAFEFSVASLQNDSIYWLIPLKKLLVGTAAAEYTVGDSDGALTPQQHPIGVETHNGSSFVQPIVTETGAILYVEKSGKRLREFSYSDERGGHVPRDVSILSSHLLINGIREIVYQKAGRISDDSGYVNVAWAITGNDNLISLTYEPEHKIYAWARHTFGIDNARYKAICSIPGPSGGEELWAVVITGVSQYTLHHLRYDSLVDGATRFYSQFVPLPFITEARGGADWSSLRSWVRMRIHLYNAHHGNTHDPRISRNKTTIAGAEYIDSTNAASNAPYTAEQYLPGSDETGQFRFVTQNRGVVLGVTGLLEVSDG